MCSKLKHFPVCAQPQHRSSRTTETSTCWSLPFHWPQSVLQQSMLGTPKLPACRANINAAQPQNSLHISGNWTRTIWKNIWVYVCKKKKFFNFSHFKVEKQSNYLYLTVKKYFYSITSYKRNRKIMHVNMCRALWFPRCRKRESRSLTMGSKQREFWCISAHTVYRQGRFRFVW